MSRRSRRTDLTSRPAQAPATETEIETTVERIVPGGFGLAHGDGRTLFVSHAAPGDRLRVRVDRQHGRVAHASVVEILDPGPSRVPTPHPLLATCGVAFQHLRYEAQLATKSEMIADCLRRIAGVTLSEPVKVHPSPATWSYRGRVEWRYSPQASALGYFETGTRNVIDVPSDPLVVPALGKRFGELRERLVAGRLPEWATEFRAAAGDDGVSSAPALELPQPLPVHTTVCGERLMYDADCFFQVNPFVLEDLVSEALRLASEPGATPSRNSDRAIDLYCGVGLFTFPLARRFSHVIGIEGQRRAAEFATQNASAAGLGQVRIEVAAVESWLESAHRTHGRPAFVLLDPPRTGLPSVARNALQRLRAAQITYVSCDPATLARDLKALCAADYEIDSVAAFDMFPQTHHVETVVHLRQRDPND